MKLWFDEDLSPTLVAIANASGHEATCNRDRGVLGCSDSDLRRLVQDEDYILVTDNASDFRPMYERDDVHPGLVVLPGSVVRAQQQELTRAVIEWIVAEAGKAGRRRTTTWWTGSLRSTPKATVHRGHCRRGDLTVSAGTPAASTRRRSSPGRARSRRSLA